MSIQIIHAPFKKETHIHMFVKTHVPTHTNNLYIRVFSLLKRRLAQIIYSDIRFFNTAKLVPLYGCDLRMSLMYIYIYIYIFFFFPK